jgi:hypothetical protein
MEALSWYSDRCSGNHSNGEVTGTTIRIPRKGFHTDKEITSHACVDNYVKLLQEM